MTAYAMGRGMLDAGHRLTIVALTGGALGGEEWGRTQEYMEQWHALGAGCEVLDHGGGWRPRPKVWQRLTREALFPSYRLQAMLVERLEKLRPDALLLYHWDALAATWGVNRWLKVGLVGDPVHLPSLFRREFRNDVASNKFGRVKGWLYQRLLESRQTSAMVNMLDECQVAGAFAAHHAQMLRHWGVKHCRYFRSPVPDPDKCYEKGRSRKLRVLHIGHLQGIATLTGIKVLVEEIVPRLEKALTTEGFEVHVVGGMLEAVPDTLLRKLMHPVIKLRGQVTPADEEFRAADILIVPTPIELGIRVRIISGFSHGCAIVAHRANCAGIPELKDGENCLLGENGVELAAACLRLREDPVLVKKIADGARATFERHFSPATAGRAIAAAVDEVLTVGAVPRRSEPV